MEAILLLLYAWNSAPIPGTDLSRCFDALGREFQFPIDFSADKHFELTSSRSAIHSYLRELAKRLSSLRMVAELLIKEQRAYHREFVNARRPDPKVYSVGDIVFARRAVRSDASGGKVDKLSYPFTGPWRIVAKLDGASYELKHCSTKAKEKKHASDLSPYPVEMIPFHPLDGADNQFGQLYRKIKEHPYREAGIKGFTPPTPFVDLNQFIQCHSDHSFHWPTLSELNDELGPEFGTMDLDSDEDSAYPVPPTGFYIGPPPAAPTCSIPSIPSASILAQRIINSKDRLFFISRRLLGTAIDVREWRLVSVALSHTMALYPSCLEDGRYIVDFYISHPSDFRFNAINQRFWVQYHAHDDLTGPCTSSTTRTPLVPTPRGINSSLFGSASISLIRIRISTVLLTSAHSTAGRVTIKFVRLIGMFSDRTLPCFTILFHHPMSPHIRSTLMRAPTLHFLIFASLRRSVASHVR